MMSIQELNDLAHRTAEEFALSVIGSHSVPVCNGVAGGAHWHNLSHVDPGAKESADRAELYLDARGMLERHPDNPRLVRILKRPRRLRKLKGAA
jgi:hypothetical protein